jgi:hypothetical protein
VGSIMLTIVVKGLSLWVARRDYIDVLFPVCNHGEPHYPMLAITVGGETTERRLSGLTMSLEGVQSPETRWTPPSWMLPMGSAAQSPARNAECPQGATVLASLRLPKLAFEAIDSARMGPVAFRNQRFMLDYGTKAGVPGSHPSLMLHFMDIRSCTPQPAQPIDTNLGECTLTITNATAEEHRGKVEPTKEGETITETEDLFSLTGYPYALPIYEGKSLVHPTEPPSLLSLGRDVDPYRLCPQGYCEDCPDD